MTSKQQRGFTLVELMIALLLGSLLTIAILAVFIQAKRSSIQNNGAARMQENARFAMQLIREDLQHADFFADLAAVGENLTLHNSLSPLPGSAVDCRSTTATEPWLTNLTTLRDRLQYQPAVADGSTAKGFYSCIATTDFKPNTNILAIKRLRAVRIEDVDGDGTIDNPPEQGKTYLRTNGTQGQLYFMKDAAVPGIFSGETYTDWEYMADVYYLGPDNVLYREYLNDNMVMTREALIDDVEYFHIQFGVDATSALDLDGVPDFYTSDPGANLEYVVTARIWLLMRASEEDHRYTNDVIYHFGDPASDGLNVNEQLLGSAAATFGDGFHRRVYSTTVRLENIRAHFTLGH